MEGKVTCFRLKHSREKTADSRRQKSKQGNNNSNKRENAHASTARPTAPNRNFLKTVSSHPREPLKMKVNYFDQARADKHAER